MSVEERLQNAEKAYRLLENAPENDSIGRAALASLSELLCAVSPGARKLAPKISLAERIDAAAKIPEGRRDAALFVTRAVGHTSLRPVIEDYGGSGIQLKICELFEVGTNDLRDAVGYSERKLTHEKIDTLAHLHAKILHLLDLFRTLPSNPSELVARKQEIFKRLSNSTLKAYLNPYDYPQFTNLVREIVNALEELLQTSDSSFSQKLPAAAQLIQNAIDKAETKADFLSSSLLNFLTTAKEALANIERSSTERFKCVLQPRRSSPYTLERRYPLQERNRVVRLKVPIVNSGPGVANDCSAQIICDSQKVVVAGDLIDIGAIPPGEFALSFDCLVGEPIAEAQFWVELNWTSMRGADPQKVEFEVIAVAQAANINWAILERSDPYSTDVAQGREFVGRTKKVAALTNRFTKERMQSSYITGQKRVGKTSLTFAVEDELKKFKEGDTSFDFVYLEYGEYARANAEATVRALGQALAARMAAHLSGTKTPFSGDFTGTIAPLNQLAQLLEKEKPHLKVMIVLDEFDEIHPEMYRYGPLAEAFFSNLRTLSSKKNIGMLLVGGENMPFIIGAQGDQLNKFVREPLDYFTRAEEWDDFVELVRQEKNKPQPVNWHEAAISELFNYTNGHPYFTKLLCARIFQTAVSDRDAEITVDEVRNAVVAIINTLDVNAFAHFWKDGISLGREDAEIAEMKRRRCLVAIARTIRFKQPLKLEAIVTNRIAHTALSPSEIPAIVQDFVRREILRDRAGKYEFVVPLFEHWLVEKGVGILISDSLGEDLASTVQAAEDAAYVKAGEIVELVSGWPLYRGRRVSGEDVRAWLEQRKSFRDQRLLFKMLQNLRVVTEEQVREKLRLAHSVVKKHTSAYTPETRSQRRNDIVVTYIDGPAKSGNRYAEKYAEENLISSQCVVDPGSFSRFILDQEKRGASVSGAVIVDDFAATGKALSSNIKAFIDANDELLKERGITVVVVLMLATKEADAAIRKTMQQFLYNRIDLKVCETLDKKHFAFEDENSIWSDSNELARAKSLAVEIGSVVERDRPLGFGGLALLVVFYDGCPNNALPLLHSFRPGEWSAIFPRAKN